MFGSIIENKLKNIFPVSSYVIENELKNNLLIFFSSLLK
jgi:hypothetical protein